MLTTLALPPGAPLNERCGACTRCLDACPTEAFPRPFVLDARRCIANLTIERRAAAPVELRAGIGDHLFGCDDCQTVCPFNGTKPPGPERTEMFAPLPRWADRDLDALLTLDEESLARDLEGSPLYRATPRGLVRNALIVAANTGRRDLLPRVEALLAHPDPDLAALAAWAKNRLSLDRET